MTSKSYEQFEARMQREEYIQSIKDEYYARKNAEIEKNMQLEVSKWKKVEKKQKEVNFKETGFRETNLERKQREETSKEDKRLKRKYQIDSILRKKEGVFCIFCKTRADKNGLCYC